MYYVSDVSLLQDEMTRYHYFLQLKSDVMEGRLRCSYNEAIILAGYRLQGTAHVNSVSSFSLERYVLIIHRFYAAEFGDHDAERHTLQYLKEFVLVPKVSRRSPPNQSIHYGLRLNSILLTLFRSTW